LFLFIESWMRLGGMWLSEKSYVDFD